MAQRQIPPPNDTATRLLLSALRAAWHELNTIKARDGVAYHKDDGMPYCTEEYWLELTTRCEVAIAYATGDAPKPWPFAWEKE